MEDPTLPDGGHHLTDSELFALALPPTGQPEALPGHLSDCLSCSRALAQWKTAVRELAAEDAAPIVSRSAAEWRAAEDRTLEAIRGARPSRARMWWALGSAAAALLVAAVLLVTTPQPEHRADAGWPLDAAELDRQDRADDLLLRDVARLARGEDGAVWNTLAPDANDGTPEEERL